MTHAVTDQTFTQEVLNANQPVLVDFWAEWCGPCRMLSPVLEELAEDTAGEVQIKKLDVEQNPDAARRYGVRNIPTLILFKDGEPVDTIVGLQSKPALAALIDKHK